MRRIAAIGVAAVALGVSTGPASADVASDLGLSTAGLATLPAGFDLASFNPLTINSTIITPKPAPYPVDMTVGTIRNPPGTPAKKASKAKKTRHARRTRRSR
jgi:hypothetical protein